MGARITNPRTNFPIAADLSDIAAYNSIMLDDENSRLKALLKASTAAYVIGWGISFILGHALYDDKYLNWMSEYQWLVYISWLLIFLGFCWVPLSIFLLIQGIIIRKKYSDLGYTGDKTIGNLSVLLPAIFFVIYVGTRVMYKG